MAKGHKRGNREIRKPKANKPSPIAVPASLLGKRTLVPISIPNKKS